jgi:hypothetical protein
MAVSFEGARMGWENETWIFTRGNLQAVPPNISWSSKSLLFSSTMPFYWVVLAGSLIRSSDPAFCRTVIRSLLLYPVVIGIPAFCILAVLKFKTGLLAKRLQEDQKQMDAAYDTLRDLFDWHQDQTRLESLAAKIHASEPYDLEDMQYIDELLDIDGPAPLGRNELIWALAMLETEVE